jgi:hypothetical protein
VLDTTLCDKDRLLLAAGLWFSPGTQVSSTNKTDRHDITEILLKVALNTINQTKANHLLSMCLLNPNGSVYIISKNIDHRTT